MFPVRSTVKIKYSLKVAPYRLVLKELNEINPLPAKGQGKSP